MQFLHALVLEILWGLCSESSPVVSLSRFSAGARASGDHLFLFTMIAIFMAPADTMERIPFSKEAVARFDVPGSLLTIAGTRLFSATLRCALLFRSVSMNLPNFFVSSIGSDVPHGWRTEYAFALLIIGVASVVAFVFWELYVAHPLISTSIFGNQTLNLVS
jgi:hypothetical protein